MSGLRPLWRDKSFPIPEDGDVGDGGGEEEGAVAADRNHLRRVEAHVARQLCIEMRWRRLLIETTAVFTHSFHASSLDERGSLFV